MMRESYKRYAVFVGGLTQAQHENRENVCREGLWSLLTGIFSFDGAL